MYEIKKAAFLGSIGQISQYTPSDFPEIAFVGRSNVGKSSLINMICNNRKLAYVGQTPGKTRLINRFSVNNELTLVDLPGYGYARAAKSEINRWSSLIDQYFQSSPSLVQVFHIVDCRIAPTEDDVQMVRYMTYHGIPFCHIVSKCDKLSAAQLRKSLSLISETLDVPYTSLIPCSAQSKKGREALLDRIESVLFRVSQETT